MITTSTSRLHGRVTSVAHSPQSCRITIELSGTPELTAAIMKETMVELGIEEGQEVTADLRAARISVNVVGERRRAVRVRS